MIPLPFNQLCFKGVHNSEMQADPPEVQIDNYGVWEIELDWNVVNDADGNPIACVGHDKAGKGLSSWALSHYHTDPLPTSQGDPSVSDSDLIHKFSLEYYLSKIKSTRAFQYRPVFIYLDKKNYDNGWWVQWDGGDKKWDEPANFFPVLEDALQNVLGSGEESLIFGPKALYDWQAVHPNGYPSIRDIAGKVLPIINTPYLDDLDPKHSPSNGSDLVFHDGLCPGNPSNEINFKETGGEGTTQPSDFQSYNIYRTDNYLDAWTYKYVVPPNPIVVDMNAALDMPEYGTWMFPFRSVSKAIDRARALASNYPPASGLGVYYSGYAYVPAYSGYGWTILIKSGDYHERITIDIPLTLRKSSENLSKDVVIG
jgi:hypothetical protein